MLLDANAFQPVLTPEIALSVVQKGLTAKQQPKFDVEQVKLVYTPFYSFSFDVAAEGSSAPTGKAAINAFTGEISDYVPLLFDRPLSKTKTVNEKEAEVEETAIAPPEVRDAAAAKLAAQTGVKRDAITISAVTKVYVPFYRVWFDLADDSYRVDVDACLGTPFGLEAVPAREKTWGQATEEAVKKMKSPSGIAELTTAAVGAVTTVGSGAGGKTGGSFLDSPQVRGILILAVAILVIITFFRPSGSSVDCQAGASYLQPDTFLFVFPQQKIVPLTLRTKDGVFNELQGSCRFKSLAGSGFATARILLSVDGKENAAISNSTAPPVRFSESVTQATRDWIIRWPSDGLSHDYGIVVQSFT